MRRPLRTLCLVGSSILVFSSYALSHSWQIQWVDGYWTCFASLALDSLDRPHVAYNYNFTHSILKLARWNGSQWQYEWVDWDGPAWYPCLELDSLDHDHIALYDSWRDSLGYAVWDGASWFVETVDGCSHGPSFELDSADRPHISYCYNSILRYATKDSAGWHLSWVDWGSPFLLGLTNCIALDTLQQPHIVYSTGSLPKELRHCFWNGLQWEIDTVDPGFFNFRPSLAIDSLGRAHISYESDGVLKYATHNMGAWHITTVDTSRYIEGGTSISIDRQNFPAIAYYGGDGGMQDLWFAFWDGSSWHTEIVDSADYHPFWHGGVVSLKFNDSNQACIAYTASGGVKYAVGERTGVEEHGPAAMRELVALRLHQNWPNPFSGMTMIKYTIPYGGHVSLIVYDVAGARVRVLVDRRQARGLHTVRWDAKDNASGIYFYRLQAGDFTDTKKMILLRPPTSR